MAGLSVRIGGFGGVNAGGPQVSSASGPAPSTVGQLAYGPGYTTPGSPSSSAALVPNDPFGIAFWAGVGALAALALIRHSLPN